jgi:transposase
MLPIGTTSIDVFVCLEPCDMRKSFNGLYAIAANHLEEEPQKGAVFIFTNKAQNRIKILHFDGTGLWVSCKRLEAGKFSWPKPTSPNQRKLKLRIEALQLLVDGVDLRGAKFLPWYQRD